MQAKTHKPQGIRVIRYRETSTQQRSRVTHECEAIMCEKPSKLLRSLPADAKPRDIERALRVLFQG